MATDTRTDPYRGFNFRVEIEGIGVGAFSEVSGLTAEGDPVEYREGTDPANTVRLGPGVFVHRDDLRFAFSRSSGPGGQNVNKVSTRANAAVSP